MNELRECPFCAFDTPFLARGPMFNTHRVICPVCDCGGPECMNQSAAVSAWNRRASDTFTVTPAGKAALRGES